jgi:hypothetical protein
LVKVLNSLEAHEHTCVGIFKTRYSLFRTTQNSLEADLSKPLYSGIGVSGFSVLLYDAFLEHEALRLSAVTALVSRPTNEKAPHHIYNHENKIRIMILDTKRLKGAGIYVVFKPSIAYRAPVKSRSVRIGRSAS